MLEVIDCRFPFEFEGGHIEGALNLWQPGQLAKHLFRHEHVASDKEQRRRHVIVLHCEFSSQRAPAQFRVLREIDRALNSYPRLIYPEVYLLDGGYANFCAQYPRLCTGDGAYRKMAHPDFADECHAHTRTLRLLSSEPQDLLPPEWFRSP